jgi:hypothetical protein
MPNDATPEVFVPDLTPEEINGQDSATLNEIISKTVTTQPVVNVNDATPEQKKEFAFEKLKGKALEKLQKTVVDTPDVAGKILDTLDSKIQAEVEKRIAMIEADRNKKDVMRKYSNGDADVENLINEVLKNDIKESGNPEADIEKAVTFIMAQSNINGAIKKSVNMKTVAPSAAPTPKPLYEEYKSAPGMKEAMQTGTTSGSHYSNY